MKIEKVNVPCAVCGKECEVNVVYSYSTHSTPDLDLMHPYTDPSMTIQMCPHCHYASYDLEKLDEDSYPNEHQKEAWINDSELQELVKTTENQSALKCLIMAYRNNCNLEYERMVRNLHKASYILEQSGEMELASEVKKQALDTYKEYIVSERISELLATADMARMAGEFDVAEKLASSAKAIIDLDKDSDVLNDVYRFEMELIEKKDTARHNTEEAFD